MPDMVQIEVIMRPNGKPYRPRQISAHAIVDDNALDGVMVLGTHDIARAQALADSYAQWQLGGSYRAAQPEPGWYRDGWECGVRRWLHDEERGRAGVMFREVVEVADA